jgi:hypothetical protein
MKAAEKQITSAGAVPSEFDQWLASKIARGQFMGFDPDADFAALEGKK